jgi:lipoate-protein ligase A
MAVDEALLEACRNLSAPPGSRPVLRLYGWSVPTLSLGRFQDALQSVDQGFCRDRGIPLVRRPTGGAAVLHDREVTYAVVGRVGEPPFAGSVLETYRGIAEGIARGLRLLGVEPDLPAAAPARRVAERSAQCFAEASSYEITFAGRKVVGAAQVRRRGAALQHGSILLEANEGLFDEATGGTGGKRRGWSTLRELLGRRVGTEETAVAVARGIGEAFQVKWIFSELSPTETRLADQLRARKYLSAHWTARGVATLTRT